MSVPTLSRQMLADKEHSATRIEKILGGNLVRVFSDVRGA